VVDTFVKSITWDQQPDFSYRLLFDQIAWLGDVNDRFQFAGSIFLPAAQF
jgi:hypothetical protein